MDKQEITEIFRRYKSDNEIFHDLMPIRMREILLVATIYDAFTLEQDGLISEMIFSEFYQLNLFHAPRITNVSTDEDALRKLGERHFDLVIIISRIQREDSCELSKEIRKIAPQIPILLLLNDNAEIGAITQKRGLLSHFDNVFVWNGNSEIFLAMVKYIEDKLNVLNDTRIGLVRVILLVEDSIRYFSRYLPLLYQEIMKQTRRLVSEEQSDAMTRVLRRRARPKVILASTFEEAVQMAEAFKDFLLCVISDVAYPKEGKIDEFAGIKLAKELKQLSPDLPILLQSSESENAHTANFLGAAFVNKESESLAADLARFFYDNLGFGDFIFRNDRGREIARAGTLEDLKARLNEVPAESIVYHASRNHFSAWLMARGEVQIAKVVFRTKVTDFSNAEGLRTFLINVGDWIKAVKTKGKVIPFDETYLAQENQIFSLAEGSIGGKGRGIAFVNSLLSNFDLSEKIPDVNIRIPRTAALGVDEFSSFISRNKLENIVRETNDFELLKRRFLMGTLSPQLQDRLERFLVHFTAPLAVRSSGLLEDSLSHPLSGLYQTFFLPNNHPDPSVRLNQLMEAIKLVFASVYSKSARMYFEAIDYKIEEEKMGVVIQEVVGRAFGDYFFPHVSGVAQSYNYYPFSYIQPQDGVALVAVGLGKYVVEGEQSFRFCPNYPALEIQTPDVLVRTSQKRFFALDLREGNVDLFTGQDATLASLDLSQVEKEQFFHACTSVWDGNDQILRPGLEGHGPRVLNFPHLVRFDRFPLPRVLQVILETIKTSMETPVEIEFAIDLEPGRNGKPTFYLLQIKHLLRDSEDCTVDRDNIDPKRLFLMTEQAMGNGTLEDITDIVWIDPDRFDKSRTGEMALEIEKLNDRLRSEGRRYLLLGPGRWGTRDPWLGVPISWPQISHAKVIVEYALEEFQIDASLGSHFFHNVTSMNIGYFTVPFGSHDSFIDWEWLRSRQVGGKTPHFTHSRLDTPVKVVMDGRKGISLIYKNTN